MSDIPEHSIRAQQAQAGIRPVDATEARWDASDLDRCIHGRHPIDPCVSCPGGQSRGNQFLLSPPGVVIDDVTGDVMVRIGTTLRGDPILVRPNGRMPGELRLRVDPSGEPLFRPGDVISIMDRDGGIAARFRVLVPLDSGVRVEPVEGNEP